MQNHNKVAEISNGVNPKKKNTASPQSTISVESYSIKVHFHTISFQFLSAFRNFNTPGIRAYRYDARCIATIALKLHRAFAYQHLRFVGIPILQSTMIFSKKPQVYDAYYRSFTVFTQTCTFTYSGMYAKKKHLSLLLNPNLILCFKIEKKKIELVNRSIN